MNTICYLHYYKYAENLETSLAVRREKQALFQQDSSNQF